MEGEAEQSFFVLDIGFAFGDIEKHLDRVQRPVAGQNQDAAFLFGDVEPFVSGRRTQGDQGTIEHELGIGRFELERRQ